MIGVGADKGYDSEAVRQQIKDDGSAPTIPSRSNARNKAWCLKRIYRLIHEVENHFCRLKDWRRNATRHGKLAPNFLAANYIVCALHGINL